MASLQEGAIRQTIPVAFACPYPRQCWARGPSAAQPRTLCPSADDRHDRLVHTLGSNGQQKWHETGAAREGAQRQGSVEQHMGPPVY